MGVCFASGILTAGLNVKEMRYLYRGDIAPKVEQFFQEIMKIGRRGEATPKTDIVDIQVQSSDYVF